MKILALFMLSVVAAAVIAGRSESTQDGFVKSWVGGTIILSLSSIGIYLLFFK